MRIVLTGICAVVVSLIALLYLPVPYVWIFLFWAVALAVLAAITPVGRALWINIAAVSLALAMVEGYLWLSGSELDPRDIRVSEITPQLNEPHETLGWALKPGVVARHEVSFDDGPGYSATYTIGSNGLRLSSPLTRIASRQTNACCFSAARSCSVRDWRTMRHWPFSSARDRRIDIAPTTSV